MKSRSPRSRRHEPPARRASRPLRRAGVATVGILVAAAFVWVALPANDVPSRAKQYVADHRNYGRLLSSEQLAIRNEALVDIPAPCCDEYSIATCCCRCNLARSVWGLASRLIVERHASVATVRSEVEQWLAAINPAGAGGDACERGRCERPFHEDGCGGMDERRLS